MLGQRFIVRTDQQALKYLLDQRVVQPEYQKWVSKFLGYDFEIQYRPGLENKAADALSRMPSNGQFAALTAPTLLDVEVIKREVATDPYLAMIIKELEGGESEGSKFSYSHGILKYKNRLVLSKQSSLIPAILQLYHDSVVGGHSGFLRIYKRTAGELYW